ncbi:MAG TPA: 3-oxoacyl-ACP reductase FabG [Bacillales bacterium]|nr:3-oxoacyl-ACP reductase FabG [Bacillales bacterium]
MRDGAVMQRFSGRTVFVTGAGRGIGKSIAFGFAREGANVCLVDLNEKDLAHTAGELTAEGCDALALPVDVTDRRQVEKAVEEAADRFGAIDILVNNAGVLRDNLLFKMSDDDWDTVMNVHLKGSFHCARAVQGHMVRNGYGRIINTSSTSALGNRGQANYSTAKAGLQGFTKTLAIELGKFGITVNAVAPGLIETDMTKATAARMGLSFEDFTAYAVKEIPVGIIGKPKDVMNAVMFFAMEESSFVNGQILYVAGGPKD